MTLKLSLPANKLSLLKSMVLILIGLMASVSAFGQSPYKSRLGRFQVDQIRGCAPLTVTITKANIVDPIHCTGASLCSMDQGIGQAQQLNTFTFTYPTAGTYTLKVIYSSVIPGIDDITITVDANTQPAFEMYSCAGNQVSVKVTDNKYQQYIFDFGDGTGETALPFTNNIALQHSYTSATAKNIKVRGRNVNAADNCTPNSQPFTPIATLPTPTFSALTALDATSLQLDFTRQNRIQLKSEIAVNNGTTFQTYQSLYELTTSKTTNLKVDDNYYCFRLTNYDPCANTNKYSTIMCSQNFDLTIASGVDKLAWSTATAGITNVTVTRNKASLATVAGTQLSYDDTNVTCKTNYCYSLVANYPGGGKSTSLEKCGDAFTNNVPPKIDNISSTVIDPGVDLTWVVDPSVAKPEFRIFRSVSRSAYTNINAVSTNKYTDGDYNTPDVYCYSIDYTDACGNASPAGLPFCPIRLAGELADKNVGKLSWSSYKGWVGGVSNYVVEKYSQSGSLITSVNVGTDTTYTDDPPDNTHQFIRYIIKAVANTTGLTASVSNKVDLIKNTNLFAPTAFTPNGDKLNETFSVGGQFISKLSLKVFDRWGVMIYNTDKNEAWSGINNSGQPMPPGSYVWKVEVTNQAGQTFTEEGKVLLIRN